MRVQLQQYREELTTWQAGAWEPAIEAIRKAQKRQKIYYDRKSRLPNFTVGNRVFQFKPAEKTGKACKFTRHFHGPYRVLELDTNTARIRSVDKPQQESILVVLDHLHRCLEISDTF